MPTARTIRSYKNANRKGSGIRAEDFADGVERDLRNGQKDIDAEHNWYQCLSFDAMAVKMSTVYDPFLGCIVGFDDLSFLQNDIETMKAITAQTLREEERKELASHMMIFHSRSLFGANTRGIVAHSNH